MIENQNFKGRIDTMYYYEYIDSGFKPLLIRWSISSDFLVLVVRLIDYEVVALVVRDVRLPLESAHTAFGVISSSWRGCYVVDRTFPALPLSNFHFSV